VTTREGRPAQGRPSPAAPPRRPANSPSGPACGGTALPATPGPPPDRSGRRKLARLEVLADPPPAGQRLPAVPAAGATPAHRRQASHELEFAPVGGGGCGATSGWAVCVAQSTGGGHTGRPAAALCGGHPVIPVDQERVDDHHEAPPSSAGPPARHGCASPDRRRRPTTPDARGVPRTHREQPAPRPAPEELRGRCPRTPGPLSEDARPVGVVAGLVGALARGKCCQSACLPRLQTVELLP